MPVDMSAPGRGDLSTAHVIRLRHVHRATGCTAGPDQPARPRPLGRRVECIEVWMSDEAEPSCRKSGGNPGAQETTLTEPRPRVFVSSVMEGYDDVQDAASRYPARSPIRATD
jgi:hypothetical protein